MASDPNQNVCQPPNLNKTQEGSQNVTRNTTYGHFDQSLAETANSQFFTPFDPVDDCHPEC